MICLLAFVSAAQTNKRPRFFCAYGEGGKGAELCAMAQASSFTSNEAAERAIEKVLRPIGLRRNFVIIACPNINNAAAVTYEDGIRYIVYDNAFMAKIDQTSNTDWASLSILAHELGHHLQGHTTGKPSFPPSAEELSRKRARELEADEFSGFVMYKLGATLAQAQSAMSTLKDVANEEFSTHPKRWRRLASIQAGYEDAKSQQPLANIDRGPSPEEFFSKAYAAYEKKNYRAAIDNYTVAITFNPNFAAAYNNRALAKRVGYNDYKGAIEDYTEAIRLKPDYALAYYNRGDAKGGWLQRL
jgi:tetratricopeptide (TPR) repeat protein